MSYVVPTTRSDGYVVDAAEWNKNTVDNPIALKAAIDAIGGAAYPCNGRLTLTSGTPVTTSDVTAAGTLYFAPYLGSLIALYDGASAWTVLTFTQLSIAVPAAANQVYDVFAYNNSGTAALELTAWTNDTTRATALTTQNGVLVKTGATTRRYLGTVRTVTASQLNDSVLLRHCWNYYNRVPRLLQRNETASSWSYTSATIRQANGSASNQVDVVVGVAEVLINLVVAITAETNGAQGFRIGIGEDTTTAFSNSLFPTGVGATAAATAVPFGAQSMLIKYPAVGRHYYSWNEAGDGATATLFGGNWSAAGTYGTTGIFGSIQG